MIDELIDIIGKEAVLFESFLELLERQKQVLVANRVDDINQITAELQEKLSESRVLNRKREQVVARLKADNAIAGDITITRILSIADEDRGARLAHLRDVIVGLNTKINNARNTNALLLNQSRQFVEKTMSLLAKMHTPEPAYARKMAESDSARAVLLDRRA